MKTSKLLIVLKVRRKVEMPKISKIPAHKSMIFHVIKLK